MAYFEFTAHRVSGDGNMVFPDKLFIDDEYLIYRKSRIIGGKDIRIRLEKISSVTVDRHLLFDDIIIETKGGQTIKAHGFTHSDALFITELIS